MSTIMAMMTEAGLSPAALATSSSSAMTHFTDDFGDGPLKLIGRALLDHDIPTLRLLLQKHPDLVSCGPLHPLLLDSFRLIFIPCLRKMKAFKYACQKTFFLDACCCTYAYNSNTCHTCVLGATHTSRFCACLHCDCSCADCCLCPFPFGK